MPATEKAKNTELKNLALLRTKMRDQIKKPFAFVVSAPWFEKELNGESLGEFNSASLRYKSFLRRANL